MLKADLQNISFRDLRDDAYIYNFDEQVNNSEDKKVTVGFASLVVKRPIAELW